MNAMNIEKVKANIRAMLNLANDPAAAQGEIDNAMRFVNRLMEQHQLSDEDLSEVDDKLLELERKEMANENAYYNGSKLSEWETSVGSWCCELVGGVKYYIRKEVNYRVNDVQQMHKATDYRIRTGRLNVKRPQATFYGIAEDVELARLLFVETTATIASLAKLKFGGIFRKDGREYCEGFAAGLWTKLNQDRRSQQKLAIEGNTAVTKSTALVAIESRLAIVTKKTELAESYLRDKMGVGKLGRLSGFSRNRQGSNEARREGYSDGQRHNATAERRQKLSGPGA